MANVYDWPAAGPAVVRTPNAPYTTRILVRRPAEPDALERQRVVEMLNPSNLFDLNIGWAIMREHMMRNGDTWVGITIRPIAVDALKSFDPAALRAAVVRQPAAARASRPLHGHGRERPTRSAGWRGT